MDSDETKKGKAGRPTKFDETAAKLILGALSNGAWRRTAATIAGVDYTTLKRWLRKGLKEPADTPLGDFARKVPKAEAGCEIKLTQQIFQNAMKDPDLALRFLAVRHRKRWNPRQSVEVSGDAKRPLRVKSDFDVSKLSDADLDQLERIAEKAATAAAAAAVGDSSGEGKT